MGDLSDSGHGSGSGLSSPETSSPDVTTPKENTSSANQKAKKTWVRDYALPPCRVCGRDGSGLHYGVNTCDPCKGFFLRSFRHRHKYVCRKDNRCQLLRSRRNMCPFCRLEKCKTVGMSKEDIRHGRYQLDKKLKDIEEVKQLQSSQALVTRLVNEERKRPSVEKLVTSLTDSREKYSKVCDRYEKVMCATDINYSNQYDMSEWQIGDLIQLYAAEQTEGLANPYYQSEEVITRRLIKFAKSVPGFRELVMDDQMVLLQDFHTDCRTIHALNIYKTSLLDDDNFNPTSLMGDVFGGFCVKTTRRFVDLHLKPEEIAVLMAFAFFNDGHPKLRERLKVELIHKQLLDTLQWLLKRNHPEDRLIFCKVVETLTAIHTMSVLSNDLRLEAYSCKRDGVAQPPQILREMTQPVSKTFSFDAESGYLSFCERYIP